MSDQEQAYRKYLESLGDAPKLEAEKLTRKWSSLRGRFQGIDLQDILLCQALHVINDDHNLATIITSPDTDSETKRLAKNALQKHIEWETGQVSKEWPSLVLLLDEVNTNLDGDVNDLITSTNTLREATNDIIGDEAYDPVINAYNAIVRGGSLE